MDRHGVIVIVSYCILTDKFLGEVISGTACSRSSEIHSVLKGHFCKK